MQVFVNSLATSGPRVITVTQSDSVRNLKYKIQQLEKIDADDQTLSYCSKPLLDSLSLQAYGIKEGATIDLNTRLRGGGLLKVKPTTSNVTDVPSTTEKPVKVKKTRSVDLKSLIQRMREQENSLAEGSLSLEELKKDYYVQQEKQLEDANTRFFGLINSGRNLTALAVSSENNMFAYGTEDGGVKLYNLDSYTNLIHEYPGLHKGVVSSITFNEDAMYLISGGEDMFLKIIHIHSRQVVRSVMNFFQRPVSAIISTDNNEFFMFATGQGAMFCDISTGRFFESLEDGSSINSAALPFDNKAGISQEKGNNGVAKPNNHIVLTYESASSIAIAPDNSYIAVGTKDGDLHIYHMNGVDQIYSFGRVHTISIPTIVISKNSKYIVTGAKDGLIKIFDYELKHQIQMFAQAYQDGIQCLTITDNNEYIIAGAVDRTFKIYNFKERQDTKEILNFGTYSSLSIIKTSPDGNNLIIHYLYGKLEIFDAKNNKEIYSNETVFKGASYLCLTNDNRYIVYAKDSYSIAVYDLQEEKETMLIDSAHENSISCVILSHDNKWIISSGFDHQIKMFDMNGKRAPPELLDATEKFTATALAITSDDKYIVSGSRGGSIRITDWQNLTHLFTFSNIHRSEISELVITKDGKKMISLSKDHSIKIFDFNSRQIILAIEDPDIYYLSSLMLSHNDNSLLYIKNLSFIHMLHLETLLKAYPLENPQECDIEQCAIVNQNTLVTYSRGSFKTTVLPFNNPNEIYACTPTISPYFRPQGYNKHIFLEEDDKIRNDILQSSKDIYFRPYNWTMMHLFSVCDPEKVSLFPSYEKVQMPFLLDKYGKTPLHYLIAQPKIDYSSVTYMLEYVMDYLEHKPGITPYEYQAILDSLSSLYPFIITSTNSNLSNRFLKLCWQPIPALHDQIIPRFGEAVQEYTTSTVPVLLPATLDQLCDTEGHDNLLFEKLCLNFDYNPLSDDMLSAALTLRHIAKEEIFKAPAVSSMIDHLWQTSKKFHLFTGFFFSVLMLLISVYIGLGERKLGLEITILVITSLFVISEVVQMRFFGKMYFSYFWNWTDMVFFIFVIAGMILSFANYDDDLGQGWIYSIILIFGYARWVSYLQLFRATRNLIHLILVVLKDMWAFILIVASIIIGFSLIFIQFDRDLTYLDHIYATYNLLYGNFDSSEFDTSQKILTALILFLLSVVLLNLLISIMGDSYGKVQEASVITNSHTRLDMILESVILMRTVTKKKPLERGYLLFCKSRAIEGEEAQDEAWEERVDTLSSLVQKSGDNMEGRVEMLEKNFEELKKSADKRHTEIMNAIKTLSNK